MTFRSPYPPVEIPDVSVYDYVFGGLDSSAADKAAFVHGPTGEIVSFRQLVERVDATAGALARLGVRPGDVVALHAANSPDFAVAFHGILRAGATVTTLPVMATREDVSRQMASCGAVALIADAAVAEAALPAAAERGIPAERTIVIGGDGTLPHTTLAALIEQYAEPPEVDFGPATHVAALPYSSGTTGRPKGVKLSHRNLVANIAQIEDRIGIGPDDVVMAVLPFFHIYGMTVVLNLALRRRATLVTMPRFELDAFLDLLDRHRVSFAFIAPPIAVVLAKHPGVAQRDLSALRLVFSGAAPLDGELGRAVERRLGVRMLQGYGMSEMSPVSHLIPADSEDIPCETVGRPIPNTENKLLDPQTGAEIDPPAAGVSEPGEMCVKGPNVMLGYLGDDAATAAMIDADGFLHTGDVATVDQHGNITIVDRIKELIKYKGYQVPPAELEALLLTHPGIADAAVIGVLDEAGGEVPKAFVVRQPGAEITAEDVMDFVAEHVAPYKKVRVVEFVEAVPKSSSGKILRRELRDRERAGTV
jgi:acyl-CoA synthetase (AMP-forming)/AMP-acid ligase II